MSIVSAIRKDSSTWVDSLAKPHSAIAQCIAREDAAKNMSRVDAAPSQSPILSALAPYAACMHMHTLAGTEAIRSAIAQNISRTRPSASADFTWSKIARHTHLVDAVVSQSSILSALAPYAAHRDSFAVTESIQFAIAENIARAKVAKQEAEVAVVVASQGSAEKSDGSSTSSSSVSTSPSTAPSSLPSFCEDVLTTATPPSSQSCIRPFVVGSPRRRFKESPARGKADLLKPMTYLDFLSIWQDP